MTTQEVANRLVELCRKGEYQTVYQELYSPQCVSLEPKGAMMERCEGLEAMGEKGKAWNESIEQMHGSSIGDPVVADSHFSMTMMMDATFKGRGREKFNELCVYEVREGKIVQEQFFY